MDDLGESVRCLANVEGSSLKSEVCVKNIPAIITTKNKVISINQQNYRVPEKPHA